MTSQCTAMETIIISQSSHYEITAVSSRSSRKKEGKREPDIRRVNRFEHRLFWCKRYLVNGVQEREEGEEERQN